MSHRYYIFTILAYKIECALISSHKKNYQNYDFGIFEFKSLFITSKDFINCNSYFTMTLLLSDPISRVKLRNYTKYYMITHTTQECIKLYKVKKHSLPLTNLIIVSLRAVLKQ